MKTSELTGPALDWAVAKCEGYSQCVVFGRGAVMAEGLLRTHRLGGVDMMLLRPVHDEWVKKCEGYPWSREQTIWEPSTDWAQGGPIIEREKIGCWISGDNRFSGQWAAANKEWMLVDVESMEFDKLPDPMHGPTPLIAAMRCFVASRLGESVEIPEELS